MTPDAPEAPVIRLEEMTRRFGAQVAVDRLSLEVRRGEMFGIIGPDGAGKTTALRVVLGLLAPHSGRVETCGWDPFPQRRRLSERVGYLSQRFSLYGDLSVDENIAFFGRVHSVRRWRPRRDELLEWLRLTPFRARLADRLSGGMRQKLALACTLIHTPELLVLDEPTTGVDPVSRRDFWRILVRLQRDGLTLLLTTPYLDEAERCHRVAMLDHGRLLALDTPDALRLASRGSMLELLARPRRKAAERLAGHPDITEIETFGERLHLTLSGVPREAAPSAAERIAATLKAEGIEVDSFRLIPASLEDIFIARIRDRMAETAPETEARP